MVNAGESGRTPSGAENALSFLGLLSLELRVPVILGVAGCMCAAGRVGAVALVHTRGRSLRDRSLHWRFLDGLKHA